MSFIVRSVRRNDLASLLSLAKQFTLLSLPAEEIVIKDKIELSISSFKGDVAKEDAMFLFVGEDIETGGVVACSQIKAKKGTKDKPCYSFKVLKREHFSPDLSIGFIHQILRLRIDTNGPSEIGGLIVDKACRRRPEKIGKLISLARFMYIRHFPDFFESKLLAEMAPPLLPDGRSDFWESLGRRFTGIPYKEADALTEKNKEFIRSLFPQEDIYVCLLDAKARLALAQVGKETVPALKMLKGLGFSYHDEVDPFDGGPHYSVGKNDNKIAKEVQSLYVSNDGVSESCGMGLVSVIDGDEFKCCLSNFEIKSNKVNLPNATKQMLSIKESEQVNIYQL